MASRKSSKPEFQTIDDSVLGEYSVSDYPERLYSKVYYSIRSLCGLLAKNSFQDFNWDLWKQYLMASVQSLGEARVAQNRGWRTFRIIAPDAPLTQNEILCCNTEDDRNKCDNCFLCDGKSSKPNIADKVHGLKWKISNFVKYSESLSN